MPPRSMNGEHFARTLLVMFLVALALRLAVIPFQIGEVLDPARDHWGFGCEEGRIARSIAAEEGFSSPLFGKTGPTSWSTPVYPYLLAGVFRLFGIYTAASAWAILSLNCLFSALTCIPIYFIARTAFDPRTAFWAGWIWVLFPYSIYLASGRVWGYCLDTLVMALLLWSTLALSEAGVRKRWWVAYGFLWGVAALTNPVMLTTLPVLLGWALWRQYQQGFRCGLRAVATLVVLGLTVSPWFVRNYAVFGHFIPFRGTFWMIFWESNTGDTSDLYPDWTNPAHNETEMSEYRSLGEAAYVSRKRELSLEFLRQHPGLFLRLTGMRITFTWTGFWSLRKDYLAGEPFAFANIGFCSTLTMLMLAGIRRAWKSNKEMLFPLVGFLMFYPTVYYITHPGLDYRQVIEPVVVIFLGLLAAQFARFPAPVPVAAD